MVTSFGLPMSLPFKSNSGSKYSSRVIAVGLLLAAYSVVLVVLYKEREGGGGGEESMEQIHSGYYKKLLSYLL